MTLYTAVRYRNDMSMKQQVYKCIYDNETDLVCHVCRCLGDGNDTIHCSPLS